MKVKLTYLSIRYDHKRLKWQKARKDILFLCMNCRSIAVPAPATTCPLSGLSLFFSCYGLSYTTFEYSNTGEEKEAAFIITPDLLKMCNDRMEWITEPGDFKLMIGSSSKEIKLKTIPTVK